MGDVAVDVPDDVVGSSMKLGRAFEDEGVSEVGFGGSLYVNRDMERGGLRAGGNVVGRPSTPWYRVGPLGC